MMTKTYENTIYGVSIFSGDRVEIIGENEFTREDGKVMETYVYNIEGYTAENGKPFEALKCNIALL